MDYLIDEIVVKLNPVVFGAGIPLFGATFSQTALELIDSKIVQQCCVAALSGQAIPWAA